MYSERHIGKFLHHFEDLATLAALILVKRHGFSLKLTAACPRCGPLHDGSSLAARRPEPESLQ
jgi:hypothetical protein